MQHYLPVIEQGKVSEGAADVYANAVGHAAAPISARSAAVAA